ncbi:M23 family metallopeptidase [Fibrivirga algicola]|uniref:M23 family metallopeptidase n=1 Tax=Fibrivirga algicola TaxID=2950420 RepID=A0ABX0QG56_9BACT|nr:M23 family metallopeptidase [Fibrivirga algicola]ARK12295.1 peptidase M23 [Fibrella sp. ES10-3-2-2]NID10868.1 M23 family metallopeptidase [Fibrivirga algicola]
MNQRLGLLFFFALSGTYVFSQTTTPARSVSATQGSVVRWPGNCKRCSLEDKAWDPVNGTCYYAIDMEKKPGTYTLSRRTTGGKLESAKLVVAEKPCKTEDIKNFKKMEYVNVSAANQARHRKEMDVLNPILIAKNVEQPAVFDLPVGKPLSSLPNGEGFGNCRTFSGQGADRHTGTDYAVPTGKDVLSAGNGKVVLAANHFFSGNSVYIDHGNGLLTEYFHLKSIDVKPNQTVTKGQKIGIVGETGRTTGPHLHFGARWHGEKINPGFLLMDPSDMPQVK